MVKLLDFQKLIDAVEKEAPNYQNADPYPHAVIDNLFNPDVLDDVLKVFPKPGEYKWEDGSCGKLATKRNLYDAPEVIMDVLLQLNSGPFVRFLQHLTGIKGIIPDPSFLGGGMHQILPGGKLPIHVDFNKHPDTNLDRRLNVLLYLNKDWDDSYGGNLEMWDTKCTHKVKSVAPVFNRLVVFNTTEWSYHGHPYPLTCPEGLTRKSIALYYYSNGRPKEEMAPEHNTIWRADVTEKKVG